jgi:hypothetical protein
VYGGGHCGAAGARGVGCGGHGFVVLLRQTGIAALTARGQRHRVGRQRPASSHKQYPRIMYSDGGGYVCIPGGRGEGDVFSATPSGVPVAMTEGWPC